MMSPIFMPCSVSWPRPMPSRRKRSTPKPDPVLMAAVVAALRPAGGRAFTVEGHSELVARLTVDGVACTLPDLSVALAKLIEDGKVAYRPGVGFWNCDGHPVTLWEPDITRVADIERFFGG